MFCNKRARAIQHEIDDSDMLTLLGILESAFAALV